MVKVGYGRSHTIPLLKNSCSAYGKPVSVDDFRGISISPVLSKVLEHCIRIQCSKTHYSKIFVTSDNKKESGYSHAIYMLRCITYFYISSGSTVNMCTLDLSKAFDKMNHYGLFIKLMQRSIPNNLLLLLERWFPTGMTCVKWHSIWSS